MDLSNDFLYTQVTGKKSENFIAQDEKYHRRLQKWIKYQSKKKPLPTVIPEPVPVAEHVVCAVCKERFEDYHEHINGRVHQIKTKMQEKLYKEIDLLCEELGDVEPTSPMPEFTK